MSDDRQADLFSSVEPERCEARRLGGWPVHDRFPFNYGGLTVSGPVRADLLASRRPLIITGFSALDTLIDFFDALPDGVGARLMIGSEPGPGADRDYTDPRREFPEEVSRYWLERGVSVRLSAKILGLIEKLRSGRVEARYAAEEHRRLHAKIFLGDEAVTIGSSNFSRAGLTRQIEANVRFTRHGDKRRFREARVLAERIWDLGVDYGGHLIGLLEALLRAVSWQEALARAAADLLHGAWVERYTRSREVLQLSSLWPSQQAGIAQALWMIENVGSVLVADATGAGKTRMGAHLLRACMDRIWSTGRIRRDIPVLVCPPSVQPIWATETTHCGLPLASISHGILSRSASDRREDSLAAVRRAQILAIDEAHNFLNLQSERTRGLLGNMADHVILFTATPINRGAGDLLRLIDMLGADNLDDGALKIFESLNRRQRGRDNTMTPEERDALRREIQRFTVRRTKSMLNAMVDREPEKYRNALGRPCRFPRHDPRIYDTAETARDRKIAAEIRRLAGRLRGLVNLQSRIELPEAYRKEGWSEERYIEGRLRAAAALAAHQVMANLRSSRAALTEHVFGTAEAARRFHLEDVKPEATGNLAGTLEELAGRPPEIRLSAEVPAWLAEPATHRAACAEEIAVYAEIARLGELVSDARIEAKTDRLVELSGRHDLLIAFDSRLITLAEMRRRLLAAAPELEVIVATGARPAERRRINRLFRLGSTARGVVALCSDAMSEGINLQQASAVVQLDLPSVVRIAEQRVGRVDRMDSPHDRIEVWWPRDSREFALRTDEKFVERHQTVEMLLGSNMPLPEELVGDSDPGEAITAEQMIERLDRLEAEGRSWDGLRDAFGPVRDLVSGPDAVIDAKLLEEARDTAGSVRAAVSLVPSARPWGFFAVAAPGHGPPKWIFLDSPAARPLVHLDDVAARLRNRLAGAEGSLRMNDDISALVGRFLGRIAETARELLPKKKQRALDEMEKILPVYLEKAAKQGDRERLRILRPLLEALTAEENRGRFDLDVLAERWLDLIRPVWYERLAARRRRTPLRLRDIRRELKLKPLSTEVLRRAFAELPQVAPIEERVVACIVGVPSPAGRGT